MSFLYYRTQEEAALISQLGRGICSWDLRTAFILKRVRDYSFRLSTVKGKVTPERLTSLAEISSTVPLRVVPLSSADMTRNFGESRYTSRPSFLELLPDKRFCSLPLTRTLLHVRFCGFPGYLKTHLDFVIQLSNPVLRC